MINTQSLQKHNTNLNLPISTVKNIRHRGFNLNTKDMSEDHGKNPLTSFHISMDKNNENKFNVNCDSCNNSSQQPLRNHIGQQVRDPEDKYSDQEGDSQNDDDFLSQSHTQHQLRIGKLKTV